MKLKNLVQILTRPFAAHFALILLEKTRIYLLSPQIVGQAVFFSLGKVTNLGKGKLNSKQQHSALKLLLRRILSVTKSLGKYVAGIETGITTPGHNRPGNK